MECQILFTGKNKKNIINLSFAENAHRVVKVNIVCKELIVYTIKFTKLLSSCELLHEGWALTTCGQKRPALVFVQSDQGLCSPLTKPLNRTEYT